MSPTALRQQKRNRGASPSVERIFENAVPFSFENGPLMEKSRRFFPADRGPDDHIKRYYHGTNRQVDPLAQATWPAEETRNQGSNTMCRLDYGLTPNHDMLPCINLEPTINGQKARKSVKKWKLRRKKKR
ncbi:hypothetical protein H100_00710 [Trichophyton rubrum MR850]|nr:hypothetical protein H100_00710 [Trichophyton rubrum MR850]